jgi:oxygen-independent coproporphyrinogen III oxidase
MAGRDEAIDNRIHDVMVRCEKLAAGRGNFNSDPVVRRNQRRPRFRHVRLAGRGENKPINHSSHDGQIRFVILDRVGIMDRIDNRRSRSWLRALSKSGSGGAEENKSYVSHRQGTFQRDDELMSERVNNNCATIVAAVSAVAPRANPGDTPATTEMIRHIYVHIPFCARICPYCAFYKDLLDRSETARFCEAILRDLDKQCADFAILPRTIYFGGGTPTALTTSQLEFLFRGFRQRLDISALEEWTVEANPGSVSAGKATSVRNLGVNRISLGVQSWDKDLLKTLGREHSAPQAKKSFQILRGAGFSNINVDLMFGLPGQTIEQWRVTLQKTIALQPEHISAYCLTYEEDTEFFLRQSRGEFRQDADIDAEFFEMTMSILEDAGYQHYEISNYARRGFSSRHNRGYWSGENYLGIGPSAFSTVGTRRWQNVTDYRAYADRILSGQSPIGSTENLTSEIKRVETIALSLRTNKGVSAALLTPFQNKTREFIALGLLQKTNGNFVLTRAGRSLADLVTEALI